MQFAFPKNLKSPSLLNLGEMVHFLFGIRIEQARGTAERVRSIARCANT
jgi:hypothetical protein